MGVAEPFTPLRAADLPDGIASRQIADINGLRMHVLEAGYDAGQSKPLVLLLHGFPELAFSWRKVMLPLAAAGYHVVAPDQRGYGRTTGWDPDYDGDLSSFNMLNLVRDQLALVASLGYQRVHCVVGHDFGSPVAAWCALIRPDVFGSVALMSAPFAGPPGQGSLARGPVADARSRASSGPADLNEALGKLDPPRKHYHWYYSTPAANADMLDCDLTAFLRAYYHMKSADWSGNTPHVLPAGDAAGLAQLPHYYVMDQALDMPQSVAPHLPPADHACHWLTDPELAVYVEEFQRSGFQGGLNWYRCRFDPSLVNQMRLFSGRTIDVPACFIAGDKDWGVYQTPGAMEAMQRSACTQFRGVHLIDGAGHWVQQEQAGAVSTALVDFCRSV